MNNENRLVDMKNFIALFIASIFLFGCNDTPEKRAEKLINEEMKQMLHDYSSYESVSSSALSDAYSSLLYDSKLPELLAERDRLKANYEKFTRYEDRLSAVDVDRKTILKYRAQTDSVMSLRKENSKSIEDLINGFKPEKIGLQINHTYRAKTLGGNMKLTTRTYIFDDGITKIIRAYEADN